MENIVRNIRDIDVADRQALEQVIGQRLRENQRVIIQVMTLEAEPEEVSPSMASSGLPAWCHVYEGLSDREIAEIETVILDRDHWSRDSQ